MAQSSEIRRNFFKRPPGFPSRTLRYIIRYMNRKDIWAQARKAWKKGNAKNLDSSRSLFWLDKTFYFCLHQKNSSVWLCNFAESDIARIRTSVSTVLIITSELPLNVMSVACKKTRVSVSSWFHGAMLVRYKSRLLHM